MAKKATEVTKEKEVTVDNTNKTPEAKVETETTVAPVKDETTEVLDSTAKEAPEADDIDDVLEILNTMDELSGGKGGLTEIPDALRGSIGYLVEKLKFVREMFEDPMWQAIMDDLADQKEDGITPSIEVAIARNIPLAKLQELADSEDYEGAQTALADNLAQKQSLEDEEASYKAGYDVSMTGAEEYATGMGYDEAEINDLKQFALDQYKIWGDGELDKDEWAKIDKMRNYDKDTSDLRSQIEAQPAKEVLPDQSSVDAIMPEAKSKRPVQKNEPGLGSMVAMDEPAWQKTGKKRYGK